MRRAQIQTFYAIADTDPWGLASPVRQDEYTAIARKLLTTLKNDDLSPLSKYAATYARTLTVDGGITQL
jgi:hypothetical protein